MAVATQTDSQRSRSKTTDESIRRVFLHRRDSYASAEGAAVLGWTLPEMTRAIETRTVEVTGSEARIAWREIAVMLMARHPQAEIENALGPEVVSAIPEPVRLADLRIRIPRYQIVMLEKLAGRERVSVDELMARHLLDLASSEAAWLRRSIRWFEAAMRWPEE